MIAREVSLGLWCAFRLWCGFRFRAGWFGRTLAAEQCDQMRILIIRSVRSAAVTQQRRVHLLAILDTISHGFPRQIRGSLSIRW